jgi:hypothetical protein
MKVNLLNVILCLIVIRIYPQQLETIKKDSINSPEEYFLATDFNLIKTVEKIPRNIISEMKKSVNSKAHIFMVNPGQIFNSTDEILYPKLPSRRLIFAGQSQQYCFIYYEKGGIADHIAFVIYDCSEAIPKLFLALTSNKVLSSINELKSEMRNELPLMNMHDAIHKTSKYTASKKLFKYEKLEPGNF